MSPQLKFFLKEHGKALWKDSYGGILMLVALLILFLILERIIVFMGILTSPVTENIGLQIVLGAAIIIGIGIGARKLTKWKVFRKFLPTEIVKKPEVVYADAKGVFQLRILIRTHRIYAEGRNIEVGEVVPAQASPTSWGNLSGELVPLSELCFTGRTYGDALLSCASLGAKTKPILQLKKYEHSS